MVRWRAVFKVCCGYQQYIGAIVWAIETGAYENPEQVIERGLDRLRFGQLRFH